LCRLCVARASLEKDPGLFAHAQAGTHPVSRRKSLCNDNLLKAPGLSARVQAGNRLLEANDSRFTYNDRDHVASRDGRTGKFTYTYDSRDLLVAIEGPDFSYRAVHDGLGRRTQKTVNGQTWHYYWDTDRLAAEVFPNGHLRIYVYPDAFALVPILFLDYADPKTEECSSQTARQ